MPTSIGCTRCGAALASTDAFCSTCGTPSPAFARGASDVAARPKPEITKPGQRMLEALREITLGRFEILKLLGQGGMGTVALARDIPLDKLRAIKVLSMHLAENADMRERFFSEARTQARLEHPNIVPVYLVEQDAELPYFVMQYVPGRTLQDVLRAELAAGRSIPVEIVLALTYQIGSALAHAHRNGVVHRDIKPGNVLLNADGNAVVTDFGIAKVLSAASISVTGSFIGTPPYMSPEQCRARASSPGRPISIR